VTVSERVVRLRVAITKVELARRLGRTKGFVTRIIAGKQNLTLRTIADVREALGHRVDVGVGAASGRQVSIDVREATTSSRRGKGLPT
jgi:plasmid maintenance system antidote protein VapI